VSSPPAAPCGGAKFVLRFAWRQLVRALVLSGGAGMVRPAELRRAVDSLAPAPVWWRHEARAGLAEVDAYLGQVVAQSRERGAETATD
jgi:hypothetical protein